MAKYIPNRLFEDYDPPSDLASEQGCDTLLIYLPGFRKEQLRVQLTTSRMLKISGERPIGDNKYRRFHKEFRVPSNCDTKEISAKFEGGILYIRQPKLITPASGTAEQNDTGKTAPITQQQPLPQPTKPQQAPSPPPPPRVQQPPPPIPRPHQEAPHPQEQIPEEAAPKMGLEEEAKAERKVEEEEAMMRREKHEMGGRKDEETKDQCGLMQRPKQVVGSSGLFRELRKPDNLKRLGVSVLMVLIIGFYISYMLKSFLGNEQQSLLENDL